MPILKLNEKQILFVHIPKCGGSSIENYFKPHVDTSLFASYKEALPCPPQHFDALIYEALFDVQNLPSVAIVRHPYSRVFSEYFYQSQHYFRDADISFEAFVNKVFSEYWNDSYSNDNHVKPQSHFILSNTLIYRFEEGGVGNTIAYVENELAIGTSNNSEQRQNVSAKFDFIVTPETLNQINHFYAEDFNYLGYEKLHLTESISYFELIEKVKRLGKGDVAKSEDINRKVLFNSLHILQKQVSEYKDKLLINSQKLENSLAESSNIRAQRELLSLFEKMNEKNKSSLSDIARTQANISEKLEILDVKMLASNEKIIQELIDKSSEAINLSKRNPELINSMSRSLITDIEQAKEKLSNEIKLLNQQLEGIVKESSIESKQTLQNIIRDIESNHSQKLKYYASAKEQLEQFRNAVKEEGMQLSGKVENLKHTLSEEVAVGINSVIEKQRKSDEWATELLTENKFSMSIRKILESLERYEKSSTQLLSAQQFDEHVSQLYKSIANVEAIIQEKIKLREERYMEVKEKEELKSSYVALSEVNLGLLNEVKALNNTLTETQRSHGEVEQELATTINRFQKEINFRRTIEAKLAAEELKSKRLYEEVGKLRASYSMKVTAPLRAGLDFLLRFKPKRKRFAERPVLMTTASDSLPAEVKVSSAERVSEELHQDFSTLNVAIVVENLDRGGLEQVVLDHAQYFDKHCNQLDLFVVNEKGRVYTLAENSGINLIHIQEADIQEFLKDKNYDFAFFHHSYGYVPHFRTCSSKLVEIIHNEYSWQLGESFFDSLRGEYFDEFIAVSEQVEKYSISKLNIEASKVRTVINGLNNDGLYRKPLDLICKERENSFNSAPTFIMCANGFKQKNHVLVLKAFHKLLKKQSNAKLILAGNLEVDSEVSPLIAKELNKIRNNSSVEVVGSLERRELSNYLMKAHIALLPTKYEGFSIATLEYLYFGLPMVLSNTGGAGYIKNKFGCAIVNDEISSSEGNEAKDVKAIYQSMYESLKSWKLLNQKALAAASDYGSYNISSTCDKYLSL